MSKRLDRAGILAVAATLTYTILSADAGAVAQDAPAASQLETVSQGSTELEVQPQVSEPVRAPSSTIEPSTPAPAPETDTRDIPAVSASSLAALVVRYGQPIELSRELHCLAGAIYFESKGESLPGQLAVGRVIIARAKSGRFPSTYCGVVFQRSQFSFVRGNSMPAIDKRSRSWRDAAAIAQIAHEGSWRSPVEGALFFHAARVSPGWRLTRMARVDNHVFYR